jgi:hypothetical protein
MVSLPRACGLSATGTCSIGVVPASDPAGLLREHAPGRLTLRNLHPEPILPLDPRIDSNAPASPHRADLSLPGQSSSTQVIVQDVTPVLQTTSESLGGLCHLRT